MPSSDEQPPAVRALARRAREASRAMLSLSSAQKDAALQAVHDRLRMEKLNILAANKADKEAAEDRLAEGTLSPSLVKRLELGGSKFDSLLTGVLAVVDLPDPVGVCTLSREIDDGLQLYRVSCPIGVICVIFEARPEAAVQIASLAIKSCNSVILKGGREAERSNVALVSAIRGALRTVSFPEDAVQLVETRDEIRELLNESSYIDLIIPRGSKKLVEYIKDNTKIPVMGHADGICAVYIDAAADAARARDIIVDAKAQYPAVCNAAETMLIHQGAVADMLPVIGKGLAAVGVAVRADECSRKVLDNIAGLNVTAACAEDFRTEFLDLTLAVKVVETVDAAIAHINEHGSGHTDCVVTEDMNVANKFMNMVDSAGVYHNASTRFADGFRLGFGAEVGVSTHRTHARGPVGLEGLMIYKYKLMGRGHVVGPYVDGEKSLKHRDTPEKVPLM